jgi:iron(III) transport system ATP-binding protein
MREELKNLQRTLGLTTIFVTHDQEEAMTTADRMAVLDKGVLQQVGTATALFDYPANRFVAGFVGTANLWMGKVTRVNGETLTFQADGVGELVLPSSRETPGVGRPPWLSAAHGQHPGARRTCGRFARLARWSGGKLGIPG